MVRIKNPDTGMKAEIEPAELNDWLKTGWVKVEENTPAKPENQSTLTRTVEEDNTLKPGEHEGIVVEVEPRTTNYKGQEIKYVDIHIKCDDKNIKAGYPDFTSETSMLGKLLSRFGADVKTGTNIDMGEILNQTRVLFQTTTDEKGYARIDRATLKPKGAEK